MAMEVFLCAKDPNVMLLNKQTCKLKVILSKSPQMRESQRQRKPHMYLSGQFAQPCIRPTGETPLACLLENARIRCFVCICHDVTKCNLDL